MCVDSEASVIGAREVKFHCWIICSFVLSYLVTSKTVQKIAFKPREHPKQTVLLFLANHSLFTFKFSQLVCLVLLRFLVLPFLKSTRIVILNQVQSIFNLFCIFPLFVLSQMPKQTHQNTREAQKSRRGHGKVCLACNYE